MDRKELDVRGLKCPMPIVLTRRALDRMETGKVLRVVASEGLKEFQAFAAQTGHELQFASIENGEIELLLWRAWQKRSRHAQQACLEFPHDVTGLRP